MLPRLKKNTRFPEAHRCVHSVLGTERHTFPPLSLWMVTRLICQSRQGQEHKPVAWDKGAQATRHSGGWGSEVTAVVLSYPSRNLKKDRAFTFSRYFLVAPGIPWSMATESQAALHAYLFQTNFPAFCKEMARLALTLVVTSIRIFSLNKFSHRR